MATVLLEAGASLEATDGDGHTPLKIAVDKGHEELARVLRLFEQRRATPQTLPASDQPVN